MLDVLDLLLERSFLFFFGLTLVLALVQYPRYFDTPLKYYPILIMYTFLNELLGYLINIDFNFNPLFTDLYAANNVVFYNVFNFIFFTYFFYVYWCFIKSTTFKKNILILSIGFILVSLFNTFLQDFLLQQQIYSYTFGGLIIIYSTIFYLKENNRILRSKIVKQSLLFWISIGLLIFYIGYIPIKNYYSYTSFEHMQLYYNIKRVHLSLVGIMYSFIIYGFIQMKGKLKI